MPTCDLAKSGRSFPFFQPSSTQDDFVEYVKCMSKTEDEGTVTKLSTTVDSFGDRVTALDTKVGTYGDGIASLEGTVTKLSTTVDSFGDLNPTLRPSETDICTRVKSRGYICGPKEMMKRNDLDHGHVKTIPKNATCRVLEGLKVCAENDFARSATVAGIVNVKKHSDILKQNDITIRDLSKRVNAHSARLEDNYNATQELTTRVNGHDMVTRLNALKQNTTGGLTGRVERLENMVRKLSGDGNHATAEYPTASGGGWYSGKTVEGWDDGIRNPRSAVDCARHAKDRGYVAWGHRNANHPSAEHQNTCWFYHEIDGRTKHNDGETHVHTVACVKKGARTSDNCR